MDGVLIAGIVLLCLSFALVLHHKWKHSRLGDDYIQDRVEQWFQVEDVCNSHCAHEKFVVLFGVVGGVLVIVGLMHKG